jgi:hypothetical protein
MADMNREALIALLDKLGDSDDATVAATAREIDGMIKAAELGWDDLLRPDHEEAYDDDDVADDVADDAADDVADDTTDDMAGAYEADPTAADGITAAEASPDLDLIESLLKRKGLSADTLEELRDLKRDIAEGDFTAMDRKYLRALDSRLA